MRGFKNLVALVVAIATMLVGNSNAKIEKFYSSCHTGKGDVQLYNCNRHFDLDNDNLAELQAYTIPTRYVLKLKENAGKGAVNEICSKAESNNTYSGYCVHKYNTTWTGMLMVLTGNNLYQLLENELKVVEHVEVEGIIRVSQSTTPSIISMSASNVTQTNPPSWGLDRIDHQAKQALINKLYSVTTGGTNVHVYVVDTGIRCSHKDFYYSDGRLDSTKKPMSRCLAGYDIIGDGYLTNDCNGHGTHCAGIVAGLQSGVAKNAFVHPIRALSCDGSGGYGNIINALDWLSINVISPAVVSMSLASPASISIDQAITNFMDTTGTLVVVASGNFHDDACNYSPARVLSTLSVGASSVANVLSWFSNYGTCTSIIAPGELITSTWNTSDTSYNTISGTSMACPHVAGGAALYLSQYTDARPKDIKEALLDACEVGAINNNALPNTTTKLLNVVNMMQPNFNITPRAFYNVSEGTSQTSMISLRAKPTSNVMVTPALVDSSIGYFQPTYLYFANDASWSMVQKIKLVLANRTDYLDRGSVIQWSFSSQDARYNISPEGYVMSLDTAICKWSIQNPCGQNINNPKIIPQLPFAYVENTMKYKNVYDVDYDYCHNVGPDVIFQYTPTSNVVVTASLNGTNTDFDTILSAYQKTIQGNVSKLTMLGCNDDAWNQISILPPLSLKANLIYVFIVDGWSEIGGLFDFILTNNSNKATISSIPMVKSSSIQVSTQSVDSNTATKWNSRTTNESIPLVTPPQISYFWSAYAWAPCSALCGGGQQVAQFKCYFGNYIEVDASNCLKVVQPKISQECNVIECRQYDLFIGPWSECNKVCGQGIQTRLVLCLDNLGNIAQSGLCGPQFDLIVKTQICISQTCNTTYWDATDWEFCNVPCGMGIRSRDVICRSSLHTERDSTCYQLPLPITQKTCNTHPCQTYSWLVGPWSDCFGTCEGIQTRQVQCVNGLGVTSPLQLCDARSVPASTMSCLQSNVICDNQLYCSDYGKLKEGKCNCEEGWEGRQCEKCKKCQDRPFGLVDKKLDCCPYDTIDINHKCCKSPISTLTIDGLCCEEGNIDACGQCNGIAKYVDSQSTCCSTIRDEKGICCSSGYLDECHVCNGDGITCATNVTLLINFNSDLTITNEAHEQWKLLLFVLTSHIVSKLGLGDGAIILSSVQLQNSYAGDCTTNIDRAEACLRNGSYNEFGIIDMTLLPKPKDRLTQMIFASNEMYQILKNMQISNEFSLNANDPKANLLVSLYVESILKLEKVGVCGNGVCEKGERCDTQSKSAIQHGDKTCCFEDCPYISTTCPIPLSGPNAQIACSGKGICLDTSGQCQCFTGYGGKACNECLKGWKQVKNGTLCIIMAIFKPIGELDLSQDSTNNPNDTSSSHFSIVAIFLSALFFSVVACFMFRWQNSITQRHRYSTTTVGNM